MSSFRTFAKTDVGLVRDGNEDAALISSRLIAVADGMGGHAAGEGTPAPRGADRRLSGRKAGPPLSPSGGEGCRQGQRRREAGRRQMIKKF